MEGAVVTPDTGPVVPSAERPGGPLDTARGALRFARRVLLAFCFLAVVYGSALHIPYAHHDQLRYFGEVAKGSCRNDPQHGHLLTVGRPVAAYLECLVFRHAERLEDLFVYRWLTVGLLAVALVVFARALAAGGFEPRESLLLAAALATLPGVENAVYMTNLANALAILLAALAALCFQAAHPPVVAGERRLSRRWIAATLVTLALALCTYQPFAFLFFLPLIGRIPRLAKPGGERASLHVRASVALLAVTSAVYVLWIRFFPLAKARVPQAYRFDVAAPDLAEKLARLFTEVIPRTFTFWAVTAPAWVGWVVAAALAAALLVAPPFGACRGAGDTLRARLARLAVAAVLVLSGLTIWLVSAFSEVLERLLLSSMAAALLFAHLVLRDLLACFAPSRIWRSRLGLWAAGLLAAVGALQISCLHDRNVWNAAMEAKFVEAQLAYRLRPATRRVHLIRPLESGYGYDGYPTVGDEFNRNSADYPWHHAELVRVGLLRLMPRDRIQVLRCDLPQAACLALERPGVLVVTASDPMTPIYPSPGLVVIDMNILLLTSGLYRPAEGAPPPTRER
ncbi:MAG TPA: glucosyltransferase domain-containing protein [Thermoanaerobaculia bacterium]|jgi:hypothetical protein|nr:glucosyltransferase domain-containing protein [Thermoanaerobaculia bacterium]